jgi:hypothetical protein
MPNAIPYAVVGTPDKETTHPFPDHGQVALHIPCKEEEKRELKKKPIYSAECL